MAKCRTWTFILYPEDEGYQDFIDYFSSDNVDGVRGFYITHAPQVKTDKETGEPILKEDGTPDITKEHTHFCIQFPNARSQSGVCKALGFAPPEKKKKKVKKTEKQLNKYGEVVKTVEKEIEVDEDVKTDVNAKSDEEMHTSKLVFSVNDVTSIYYYFLHWSYSCQREGKERYSEDDIKKLGNDSADFVLLAKGQRDLTTKVTCAELLQRSENCKDARSLLMNVIDDEHLVKFLCKNPYFVKSFILRDDQRK